MTNGFSIRLHASHVRTRKGETRMEIERHSEASYCTRGSANSIQLESIVLFADS